jgi:hypothetical protein
MRTIVGMLIVATLAASAISAADIKSTTKIHIAVAGAASRSSDIADAGVLSLSNVFAGNFIGALADVPNTLTLYTVTFDVQARDGIKSAAYVVQYGVDGAGQAYIYLPGRGEPSYQRNVSTILRVGQDGRWHHASPEWSAAIQPYLP